MRFKGTLDRAGIDMYPKEIRTREKLRGQKKVEILHVAEIFEKFTSFFSTFLRPRRDNVSEDSAKVQRLKNKLQTRLTHILKLIFNNFKMWR